LRKYLLLLFALLLTLSGCDNLPFGYTPLGEIARTPGRFEGKPVKVRGEVVSITKIPLVEFKSYTLRDETGEILVLTEGDLPPLEETVAIKAQVKTMAIFDDQSFGLRLVEIEQLHAFGSGG